MKHIMFFIIAGAALSGCASQESLEATPVQRALNMEENYQAVYARTNRGMRNCFEIGSSFSVDGQLYPELDYGEVTAAGGGFSYQPLLYVRVAKAGNGSRIEMKTMIAARQGSLDWVEYWANGGLKCPALHYNENPPS